MHEDPLPETLDVVVLRQQGDQLVPVTATIPISLDDETEPVGDLLNALLDSAVQLAEEDGVPERVRAVFRDDAVPPAFRRSPWLMTHRSLVLHDDQRRIGRLTLRYTDRDGLTFTCPETDDLDG